MKKNATIIVIITVVLVMIAAMIAKKINYEEPTGGMDVSAGLTEKDDQLNYWFETDFIPNAKYTVGITLYFPIGESSSLIVPLKETTFRANENTNTFEDFVSVQAIKDEILSLENKNSDNLELAAKNWRDYEYTVSMYRTKFWKTYDSIVIPSKLKINED